MYLSAPLTEPGHVIRPGHVDFPKDVYIYASMLESMKRNPTGENLIWTTDLATELPIKMHKADVASAPPITILEAFTDTVRKWGSKTALCYKPPGRSNQPFAVFNWSEYWSEVCSFAKALLAVGHKPRECVAVMGTGAPCWLFCHMGTIAANGVAASIYPTNGAEVTEYILQKSAAVVAVVDTVVNMRKILDAKLSGRCPNLKHIVMYIEFPAKDVRKHNVWCWTDFVQRGHETQDWVLSERIKQQTPGMCCELVYTSGTTGTPKGVMLSHDNCLWTTYSLLQGWTWCCEQNEMMTQKRLGGGSGFWPFKSDSRESSLDGIWHRRPDILSMQAFTSDERIVAYLPLSHIASQIIDIYIPLLSGCSTYFAMPDALRGSLIVTLLEVRPTFFFGVPRVYEKMEEKIRAVGANARGVKRRIMDFAKSLGLAGTSAVLRGEPAPLGYNFIKATALRRVRDALGLDQCKVCASGAAPLPAGTQSYFMSLGIPICDMYGMSECSGPQTSNASWPGWFRMQSSGVSLPGTEILIHNQGPDGIGEICFRGRNVFMGYHNDQKATVEALDSNGFLHSGDMGYIDDEGFLKITGRLKELLVTAGGENIAPVAIEHLLKETLPVVSNCMVVGDRRNFLSMLVAIKSQLDTDGNPTSILDSSVTALLQSRGSSAQTVQDAVTDTAMWQLIEEALEVVNSHAVNRAHRINRFAIIPGDFTVVGGELTPTMKLRRSVVLDKYKDLVDSIYNSPSEASTREPSTPVGRPSTSGESRAKM